MAWTREEMAARAAREIGDGFYVNLGVSLDEIRAKTEAVFATDLG